VATAYTDAELEGAALRRMGAGVKRTTVLTVVGTIFYVAAAVNLGAAEVERVAHETPGICQEIQRVDDWMEDKLVVRVPEIRQFPRSFFAVEGPDESEPLACRILEKVAARRDFVTRTSSGALSPAVEAPVVKRALKLIADYQAGFEICTVVRTVGGDHRSDPILASEHHDMAVQKWRT
jgi:hypothetical protein